MTISRWAGALALVACGWLATLALVMLLTDAAPGAIAVLPGPRFVAGLPEGAGIVGGGPFWTAVRSDAPGLGLSLYRAGALLVLPAGLPGCFPLGE